MRSVVAAPTPGADPDADRAALRGWLIARDTVLRGLVHALSNRVGTVIAVGGLLDAGSADLGRRILGGEADRLEQLLDAFRLVTTDPLDAELAPEPVVLTDALRDATAIRAQAGDAREMPTTLVGVEDAPPLLVSRAALTHALLVLLSGARRVDVTADADFVAVRTEPAISATASVAIAWLLRASGGRVDGDQAVLIPRFGTAHAPGAQP